MSVFVASKVRNAEFWLPQFLSQLEQLEGDIKRVAFMYGESHDRTFAYLDHYRRTSRFKVSIYRDPWLPPEERHGAYLARIKKDIQELLSKGDEQYYLNVDCDLVSLPKDLILRLMEADKDLIAAMIWTQGRPQPTFYDVYVYRVQNCRFHPLWPPGLNRAEPFIVDSVSSCYLAKRDVELAGEYSNPHPHIPFCASLKAKGYQVWVHPRVGVEHYDMERIGVTQGRQQLPIKLSMAPYIADNGMVYTPEQVNAHLLQASLNEYGEWVKHERRPQYEATLKFLTNRPLITASYKVYNEAEFLPYSLESVYPYVDRIDIVEGAVKLRVHEGQRSSDGTIELIQKWNDPDDKIRLIMGQWDTKEQVQSKLLELCSTKWMLFIDGDEIVENMVEVRRFCEAHPDGDMVYARPERFVNFVHDFHHIAYSLNPLSPWAGTGLPHPFLIHRDIAGLNFGQFHTIPMDGFGVPIHSDEPTYRGRRAVLDKVYVYHYGNAKIDKAVYSKLDYERRRGFAWPMGKRVEDDWYFTGKLPEDMVLEEWKALPDIMVKHPRAGESLIEIVESKPNYVFRRLENGNKLER